MVTWNPPSDTELAHKKPITLQQGRAIRDLAQAVAEGVSGAPRVQPAAMVDFAGLFYTDGGTDDLWALVLPAYPISRLRISAFNSVGASTASTFRMRASQNGGSTWGAYVTIDTFASSAPTKSRAYEIELNLLTGVFSAFVTGESTARNQGTLAVAAGTNAIEFSLTAGDMWVTAYCVGVAT